MLLKKMRVLAFVLIAALLLCPLQMVSAYTGYEDIMPTPEGEIIFKYTADDALHILQACVGIIVPHSGPEFDVNQDEKIDTTDALLALQSAVGLITISWPNGTAFPE